MAEESPAIKDGIVLRFCHGHSCGRRSQVLEQAAREVIEKEGLADEVAIAKQYCFGRCALGANILIERWRNGGPNQKAMLDLLMGVKNADMCFAHDVREKELSKLILRHLQAWRRDR